MGLKNQSDCETAGEKKAIIVKVINAERGMFVCV